MSGSLIPNAKQQFLDANGNPLAGGFVYYYIPSTTTFKNTYQNAALTILNTNPIILDSAGECIAYGVGSFRQIVTDVNGNLIWDQPTVSVLTNDASNVYYIQGSTGSVSRTVTSKLQESVSVLDFGATLNGSTSDQTAFSNAVNSGAPKVIITLGILYLTTSITVPSTCAIEFQYGAKAKIASGQTLTIASQIIAENAPIFVDPYSVSFTGNQSQIKPKWLNV